MTDSNETEELQPPVGASPPPHRRRRIAIATVAAAGIVTGGAFAADAALASGSSTAPKSPSGSAERPGGPGGAGGPAARSQYDLDGTLTAASSSSVTVRSLFGTSRTYTVNSSTAVHRGPTKFAASSLAVGDHVGVHATKSGSTYVAKDIDVRLAHIDGAVASADGDTITVTDRDGFTRTIAVSSSTKYTKDGKTATRSAVTTGAAVRAEGSVASDKTTLDATRVDVVTKEPTGPAGPGGMGGPGGRGPGGHGPGGHGPGGPGSDRGPGGSRPSGAPSGAPTGKPSGAPTGAPSTQPSGSSSSGS